MKKLFFFFLLTVILCPFTVLAGPPGSPPVGATTDLSVNSLGVGSTVIIYESGLDMILDDGSGAPVSLDTLRAGAGTDDQTAAEVPNTPAGNIAAETVQAAINELDTEKLAISIFDAHSILNATTDNTPAALTITEQTVLGRATGGNIAALAIDSDLAAVSANDDTLASAKAIKAALDAKQATLTNEAGLYSALSDVTQFYEPGDTITGVDGQLFDLSAITQSNDTNEGLILPTWANVTVVGLTNGAIAWDEATDAIKVKSAAGWQSIGASAAPTDGSYLTLGLDATLSAERVLTAGDGIDFTDGGANSTLTIAAESAAADNPGIVELATNAEASTGEDTERAVTPAGLKYAIQNGTFTAIGTLDISGATVTFGLETTDIPDLSGTYEVQLNNEAGLYAVLSDVTMFLEDLVDDTTPQLGGDLDVNSHEIQSSGDIVLQLGDAAGVNDFVIQDSAGTPVFSVNSDGTISQVAVNNPYILFDDNDMATEFAIRSTDSTTPDQLTIGTTTDAMATNFTTLGYFDVNKFDYDGNVNISTGHTYQINGTQINIGNLGAGGNWTPTGTLNLDSATLQNIGHGTVTSGDNYTTISNSAGDDTIDELMAAIDSWAAGVSAGTLVSLSDVGGSDVYTAGYLIIADGSDSYDPKAISGAITLASDGATTLNANSTIGTSLAIGADPADAGTIRLPNAGSLVWEDATEASITHVDNTGWLINAAHQLQFRDSAIYIASLNDGYLDLEADTGIRINGPVTFANEGAITLPANSVDSDQYVDNSIDAAHISDWYAYDVLPIGWAEDGTAAPDAIDDTTRAPLAYRTFAADSTEDVNFVWFVPSDLSGSTVQYRVKYLVTNATGPSNEGVAFAVAGVSAGDNDATNAAKGTAVTVTDTGITAAQHDILITDWSGDLTITALAAGEVAELSFNRDHDHASDDYGQVVGVLALEIRYVRNVSR